MALTSKTFVWWDNISENTSLPELIRLINTRRVKLDLGSADGNDAGPGDVPGLVLWLRADDLLLTNANNDRIAFWQDASLNGYHATQPTSTREGTFKINVVNGLPAVEFSGDDYLITV
jgi:hypothetical protein